MPFPKRCCACVLFAVGFLITLVATGCAKPPPSPVVWKPVVAPGPMVAGMQRPFVYKGFPGVVDTARQEVVAYGGYTCCSTFYSDTWVLKNAKWSKLSPANSPGKRAFHAIAYDAARGRAVLFGGQ